MGRVAYRESTVHWGSGAARGSGAAWADSGKRGLVGGRLGNPTWVVWVATLTSRGVHVKREKPCKRCAGCELKGYAGRKDQPRGSGAGGAGGGTALAGSRRRGLVGAILGCMTCRHPKVRGPGSGGGTAETDRGEGGCTAFHRRLLHLQHTRLSWGPGAAGLVAALPRMIEVKAHCYSRVGATVSVHAASNVERGQLGNPGLLVGLVAASRRRTGVRAHCYAPVPHGKGNAGALGPTERPDVKLNQAERRRCVEAAGNSYVWIAHVPAKNLDLPARGTLQDICRSLKWGPAE